MSSVQLSKTGLIFLYKLDYVVLFTITIVTTRAKTPMLRLNCSLTYSQVRIVYSSTVSHFVYQVVQKPLVVRFIGVDLFGPEGERQGVPTTALIVTTMLKCFHTDR